MKWKELIAKEPMPPPQPPKPSAYGNYGSSSKRYHEETIRFSRILKIEARINDYEADEEADELRPDIKPEVWRPDTRIDLSEILSRIPEGVDPGSVFLNLGMDRDYVELTIDLVQESPRDTVKENAAYDKAMAEWQVLHDQWKAEHDAWDSLVTASKMEVMERNLARLRSGTQLDRDEIKYLGQSEGWSSSVARHYGNRTGLSPKESEAAVDDYLATKS